jgi:hypothetical protein
MSRVDAPMASADVLTASVEALMASIEASTASAEASMASIGLTDSTGCLFDFLPLSTSSGLDA